MLLAGYLLYRKFYQGTPVKKRASRQHEKLTRKEETALKLLQARGYRLQETRPTVSLKVNFDGKEKNIHHRTGFTVQKGGDISLVKPKKSSSSPLSSQPFRQELLLDFLLFQPSQILIYDGEKKNFQELDFSFDREQPSQKVLLRIALATLIFIGIIFLAGLLLEGVFV